MGEVKGGGRGGSERGREKGRDDEQEGQGQNSFILLRLGRVRNVIGAAACGRMEGCM